MGHFMVEVTESLLCACSRRCVAKPSNSGVALKYQYVSLTLT